MKQVAGMLALFIASPFAFSDEVPELVLDKINFQIATKQWVTTQTALLSVNINVTLNNADLVKARSGILDRLNQIAKGDWHLIQFDRSQDSSGLEKLYVQAQARVDQSALTDVYKNAKSVSAPGANYQIGTVEFKPSLEETQGVRAKIREQLYQKVTDEMTRINKIYPLQHYSVSHLIFVDGDNAATSRAYETKEMNTMAALAAAPAPLTVSNEIVMTAVVEAASNRKQGN